MATADVDPVISSTMPRSEVRRLISMAVKTRVVVIMKWRRGWKGSEGQ